MKKILIRTIFIFTNLFLLTSCQTGHKYWGKKISRIPFDYHYYESGLASFYGQDFAGKPTARGENFDPKLLTAASKTLPLNTLAIVEDDNSKRFVIVRINDRGPYVKGRVIDLSEGAAKKLGIQRAGVSRVNIYTLTEKPLKTSI